MALEFERAAELRDQIALLRRVQDQQSMEGGTGDVDVVAVMLTPGGACVHLISVRGGRVLGSKNFFPQVGIEEDVSEVMAAFLGQYFISSPERDLPSELIVNAQPPLHELWLAARRGGFHFRLDGEGLWRDTRSGDEFFALLSACASEQSKPGLTF